ncbi:MAG: RES family NAD+ phosphorylase [Vulcanimicrobiaceae bacterium]
MREGLYYRVCRPDWENPALTAYSKRNGGRWNPPGEFGALYLNATIAVAVANAHRSISQEFGTFATFADLRTDRLPNLQVFTVRNTLFVDAVSTPGLVALGLPGSYPHGCSHSRCQAIARKLYAANEAGVAARSAVTDGEELTIFDSHTALARRKPNSRIPFAQWYPGLA